MMAANMAAESLNFGLRSRNLPVLGLVGKGLESSIQLDSWKPQFCDPRFVIYKKHKNKLKISETCT